MRYSRCMQAGKQLTNLKTIVHTQLSKHLVYELGETLYSGPPTKEAEENHVSAPVLASSAAGFDTENQPNVWVTCPEQDLTYANTLHIGASPQIPSKNCLAPNEQLSRLTPSKNHFPKVFPDHLVLEEYSNIAGPLVNDCALTNSRTLLDSHNGTHDLSDTARVVCVKGPNPIRRSPSPAEVNLAMVRLIQEPKTKADPLSLRRASRLPPKRGSSVDCIDSGATRASQLSQKELRSRRVSCCPSDHVTFETVEDTVKSTASTRRPRNGEAFAEEHPLSGAKLNGDVPFGVNGLTSKPVKARRGSRTSSDDSEVVSWCSQKTNGVVEPVDNDRVDINLLLEISAKDRKRFESKKAKIKRKCADWMLITETEQYYNEKEEILRIKSREEEESDEDQESESDTSEGSTGDENGGPNIRRAPTDKKNPVDDQVDKSRSSTAKKDPLAKKRLTKTPKKDSHKNDDDSASSKKSRVRSRSTRNVKELSTLEEEDILFTETGSQPLKGKGLSDKDKNPKPRKRLSDAERFLRDNREYYQFPETRERLRRNASSSTKEHQEELSIVKVERVVESPARDKCQPSLVDPVTISSTTVSKNHKKKANKCSSKETKEISETQSELSKPQLELITKSTVTPNDVPKPPPVLNETLDNLYFSFEGAPIQETWYQTYQRFIDGAQNSGFVYPRETLQFILPYEMPKEYLKDLCAKKNFLSKRKGDLSDLVRKSPRCHASTLALFSNIFPSKKKKKAQSSSAVRTDEISSDGTSTPIPEITTSVKRPLVSDMFETEEEMMFIGECMEHIMKSALEEDLSPHSMAESIAVRESRKSTSKRRAKGKRANAPPKRADKVEIPLDSKVFDNPLAAEVDSQFLLGLPRYLEEVSLVPEDTFCKTSMDLVNESCLCECTEPISCDEASSVDERTEVSSESLSLCDSETVDSFNSNFSAKMRKSGPPFKKRRKNLTGWPTRKKRRPAAPPSTTTPSNPPPLDDNDNTSFGFDDHETSKTLKREAKPPSRTRVQTRRPFTELLEPCSDLNLHALGHDRRASPRKRSSVLYMETWPLRFRHHK